MLRIGFDAKRLFNNFTGLGNYSRNLVSGLQELYPKNSYYLFTPKTTKNNDTLPFFGNNFKIIQPNKERELLWRTKKCTNDIKKLNLDIYHGLSHEIPLGIKKTNTKSIVTIHDLIYKTYPNDFSYANRCIYDFKFRYACKKSDKIIAISKSTKNDIIKYYDIHPNKIGVVYQTCHNMFKTELNNNELITVKNKYKLPNNFLLYVGSVIERKNLLGVVKAIETLPKNIKTPLIVIGNGGSYLKKVRTYVINKKLENEIIFLNSITYLDLPALYQMADMLLYPSQYEGFGIPIIEALWSKTPVITSNLSSLPEAAGRGAYYCNPNNIESIKNGIEKILTTPIYKKELIAEGYNYVRQFDTKKVTDDLITVYTDVLNN